MRKIKKIMMVAMSMILVAGMVMPLHAAGEWNCDTGLSVWTRKRVKAYDYKRHRCSN